MIEFLLFLCLTGWAVLLIVSVWIIYSKAGKPGWAAIIPIYNFIVKLDIVGRPLWWLLLMFVPLVNVVVWFIMSIDLAKSFGKSVAFGVGLALLPFIFHPLLAFDDATYQGPAARGS